MKASDFLTEAEAKAVGATSIDPNTEQGAWFWAHWDRVTAYAKKVAADPPKPCSPCAKAKKKPTHIDTIWDKKERAKSRADREAADIKTRAEVKGRTNAERVNQEKIAAQGSHEPNDQALDGDV